MGVVLIGIQSVMNWHEIFINIINGVKQLIDNNIFSVIIVCVNIGGRNVKTEI